jgi:hypothetical protein
MRAALLRDSPYASAPVPGRVRALQQTLAPVASIGRGLADLGTFRMAEQLSRERRVFFTLGCIRRRKPIVILRKNRSL